jgi:hypothetical protein
MRGTDFKKPLWSRSVTLTASFCVSASRRGGLSRALAVVSLSALACASRGAHPGDGAVTIATAAPPSVEERYCAWYGNAGDDGVLYFGQAAFWSSMAAAGGDPEADLRQEGPQLIGRFDLARERLLPPLRVDTADGPPARSGVWDVLAADGRVYFTTFFETAGSVDPATGAVHPLALGGGLNELAPGPDGAILVTRYGSGSDDGGDGEVIAFRGDGVVTQRWPLIDGAGYSVAPKTPAWDPQRRALWLTTDLLPPAGSGETEHRHDAIRIDADGAARMIPEPPELQFVATATDGALHQAWVEGTQLRLRVVPRPGGGAERTLELDDSFATGIDFVQDIQPAADGRVAVTRWSGRVDVVHPDGRVGSVQLPRPDPDGLYYTGVLHGDRLCVTYCAGVSVVCVDAP